MKKIMRESLVLTLCAIALFAHSALAANDHYTNVMVTERDSNFYTDRVQIENELADSRIRLEKVEVIRFSEVPASRFKNFEAITTHFPSVIGPNRWSVATIKHPIQEPQSHGASMIFNVLAKYVDRNNGDSCTISLVTGTQTTKRPPRVEQSSLMVEAEGNCYVADDHRVVFVSEDYQNR